MKPILPKTGKLIAEQRCVHLAFPVPAGTEITGIKYCRNEGVEVVCQGWARFSVVDNPPQLTLVVFNLSNLVSL